MQLLQTSILQLVKQVSSFTMIKYLICIWQYFLFSYNKNETYQHRKIKKSLENILKHLWNSIYTFTKFIILIYCYFTLICICMLKIYYHWTSAAFDVKIFSAVDQLKRTSWGKPKTGSIFSLKNFFVTGSEKRIS